MTNVEHRINECRRLIEPDILYRIDLTERLGEEWHDKLVGHKVSIYFNFFLTDQEQNDMLQWIVEEAKTRDQGPYEVARMLLLINFAAIHTSSTVSLNAPHINIRHVTGTIQSLTHALFHLASSPEYIIPLRNEVEGIIAQDGWTKNAMGKMWKLDSFMRESQRINGIHSSKDPLNFLSN